MGFDGSLLGVSLFAVIQGVIFYLRYGGEMGSPFVVAIFLLLLLDCFLTWFAHRKTSSPCWRAKSIILPSKNFRTAKKRAERLRFAFRAFGLLSFRAAARGRKRPAALLHKPNFLRI